MFNQLSASSGKNVYREFLKQSHLSEPIQTSPSKQESSLREKKEKLLDRLLVNSMEELDSNNLSNVIKARLRSKKIELPMDLVTRPKDHTLNLDHNHIRISNRLPNSSSIRHIPSSRTRKRLKTQLSDLPDESQGESVRPYEQAMAEIEDMNYMFYRNNKRKPVRDNEYSIPDYSYSPPPRRLNHLSRGRDFDRYINHLERLQLHRSELRHHQRDQSPSNYYPSPTKVRLPDIDRVKYKTEQKSQKNTSAASPQLIKKDNFIKVLKKVKARGESLLVKLRKFPSDRKLKV